MKVVLMIATIFAVLLASVSASFGFFACVGHTSSERHNYVPVGDDLVHGWGRLYDLDLCVRRQHRLQAARVHLAVRRLSFVPLVEVRLCRTSAS